MAPRPRARSRLLLDLGRRIAELRRERSLTQEGYAERLDVTLRYVQSIEAGCQNVTVETLAKLARPLRVTVADLFVTPTSRTVRRGRPPKRRQE